MLDSMLPAVAGKGGPETVRSSSEGTFFAVISINLPVVAIVATDVHNGRKMYRSLVKHQF